jgi:hypothetical protein
MHALKNGSNVTHLPPEVHRVQQVAYGQPSDNIAVTRMQCKSASRRENRMYLPMAPIKCTYYETTPQRGGRMCGACQDGAGDTQCGFRYGIALNKRYSILFDTYR